MAEMTAPDRTEPNATAPRRPTGSRTTPPAPRTAAPPAPAPPPKDPRLAADEAAIQQLFQVYESAHAQKNIEAIRKVQELNRTEVASLTADFAAATDYRVDVDIFDFKFFQDGRRAEVRTQRKVFAIVNNQYVRETGDCGVHLGEAERWLADHLRSSQSQMTSPPPVRYRGGMTHRDFDPARRALLTAILGTAAGAVGLAQAGGAQTKSATKARAATKPALTTYKDPNCGCCHKWVEYMRAKGYQVAVNDVNIDPIKKDTASRPTCRAATRRSSTGSSSRGTSPRATWSGYCASGPPA